MTQSNNHINKDGWEFIYEVFQSYLEDKINCSAEVDSILKKGREITDHMLKFSDQSLKENRKFLMVGKVQSGKTINFISTIVNAYKSGINTVLVFTSFDDSLCSQTYTNISEAINPNNRLSNFVNIIKLEANSKVNNCFSSQIFQHNKKNKLNIIVAMKNKIKKISDIINGDERLQKLEILIIDDEGDLGSMTHTIDKYSKTNENLQKLISLTNSYFVSVTATPQVHLITDNKKYLKPKFVHTIKPGKDYIGLEYFCNNTEKCFKIIDDKKGKGCWTKTDLKESILYYLVTTTNLLKKGVFDRKVHSNMLIHTNKKNIEHERYKEIVKEYLDNIISSFKSSASEIEYISLFDNITKLIKDYDLDIELDKKFKDCLEIVLNEIDIQVANQNSEIIKNNSSLACIVIGSVLVERGITFDNLLVTFFTNRPNTLATVDTMLQRARWFGYRKEIINYIKIFTTEKIFEDFSKIYEYDKKIWETLLVAEKNELIFENVSEDIDLIYEDLKPTSKAPNNKNKIKTKYYNNDIELVKSIDIFKLVSKLTMSEENFVASNFRESVYSYKYIILNSIYDIYNYIERDDFIKLINIDKKTLSSIEKKSHEYSIKVVLVDLKESNKKYFPNYRLREYKFDETSEKFLINNLFQGRNHSDDPALFYVGDNYWNDLINETNTIFIQVHCVMPKSENHSESFGNINPIVLNIPKKLINDLQKK